MKLNPSNWNSTITNNVIQFVFIFSSVYFAFWLTERRETKNLESIEQKAISSIYQELKTNLQQLEKSEAYHESLMDILLQAHDSISKGSIQPGEITLTEFIGPRITRRSNLLGIPQMHNNAWETFKQTEAFILLDYDLASALNDHYRFQVTILDKTVDQLADYFLSENMFEKGKIDSKILRSFSLIRELNGQEILLISITKKVLKQLEDNYVLNSEDED